MPNFIVGGYVSVNEWLNRHPDHQSYGSEFAKDMARKQEEKAFGYKSDFVREMVGSLAHKNAQGQQFCDAKAEDNNYANEHQHGNELAYNNMRRCGRKKIIIKPTSYISEYHQQITIFLKWRKSSY